MKLKRYFYLSVAIMLSLSSCSEDDNLENDFKPTTYDVLGKVEKGPFVSGSTITIQPMDGNLQVLGSLYSSTIQDDLGNFSFGSKLFEAPYAELTANGYFFNEVDGDLSSGTLNLRALVDLSDETTVNVNLLTHLKYQRIQRLIANGMKFGEANKQAQKELFTAFGLQKYADLKSATKLFSVLLASKRPLITELADKLRLKYPLLPTISPCPTMRLEAIRSIIPISCRRYPKSV